MAYPIKAAIAIVGLLVVLLLGAWLVVGRTGLLAGSTRPTGPQAKTTPAPASRPAIPRMDAAVPAQTETAGTEAAGAETVGTETVTFALG